MVLHLTQVAVITELEIRGEWARGATVQVLEGIPVTGEGTVFIAHWNGKSWNVLFEGDTAFRRLLPDVPNDLLPVYMKTQLDYESVSQSMSLSLSQSTGYRLPWPAGVTYRLSRAWATGTNCHGCWTDKYGVFHPGSQSMDVEMPRGSRIVAARGGIVHKVTENYSNCGCSNALANNLIVIRHDPNDGLYDYYLHIGKDGAIVSEGDPVYQGQPIADSDQMASVFVSATWQSKGTAPAEWLRISDRADKSKLFG